MDFHGTRPKLLEIHAIMARRVENIRFYKANIFLWKKPPLIHKFYVFFLWFLALKFRGDVEFFSKSFLNDTYVSA